MVQPVSKSPISSQSRRLCNTPVEGWRTALLQGQEWLGRAAGQKVVGHLWRLYCQMLRYSVQTPICNQRHWYSSIVPRPSQRGVLDGGSGTEAHFTKPHVAWTLVPAPPSFDHLGIFLFPTWSMCVSVATLPMFPRPRDGTSVAFCSQ